MRLTPPGGIMDVADPLGKRGLPRGGTSVSVEENMALARRFLEARANGDLDALEHMMAPDFVDHALAPSQEPDREGYKRRVAEYSAAFSNVRFVIEDQVAAGDKVVTRFTQSAHFLVSPGLIPEARSRTSTSPGTGRGASISPTVSTSFAGPQRSYQAASIRGRLLVRQLARTA
jgi:SnoaL-like polyketide cyclase